MKRIISILCLIGLLVSVVPVFAAQADALEDQLLGTVSAKYESNGNPGTISGGGGDIGGSSYGAYQFASAAGVPLAFAKWCISSGKDATVGNRLVNAYSADGNCYGSNFNSAWKAIANADSAYFLDLQHDYIQAQYYQKAVNHLKSQYGLNINDYSIAFKNAVWSRSVQHGVGGFQSVMKNVNNTLNGQMLLVTEETLIRAVYEESGAVVTTISGSGNKMSAVYGYASTISKYGLEGKYMKYFNGNSSSVQVSVFLRLRVNELNDLLAMLKQYGGNQGGSANYGTILPTLKMPTLTLTEGTLLTGFYTDSNSRATAENMVVGEGIDAKQVVVYSPLEFTNAPQNIGGSMKLPYEWNATGFKQMKFALCLELDQQSKATMKLTMNTQTITYSLANYQAGWHTITVNVPTSQNVAKVSTIGIAFQSLTGCVAIDAITASVNYDTAKTAKINTSSDDLNCRAKPSSSGTLLGQFKKGETVTLLGNAVSGWYMCYGTDNTGKAMIGWCSGDYLSNLTAIDSPEDTQNKTAAQAVQDKIAALPDTITLANESAVESARTAYEGLTAAQKALVTNLSKLTAAEQTITDLTNQAAAQAVQDKIAALPNSVTLDNESAIRAARAAYNGLTAAQKALVTNYSKLTAAEQVITHLNQIKTVQERIAKLPSTITINDDGDILAARRAYDALSDSQKAEIANLSKLIAAENAVNEIKKNATVTLVGDTNQDGTVTANDALLVLKWVVGKTTFTVQEFVNADADGSEHIEATDALMILKIVVGKI